MKLRDGNLQVYEKISFTYPPSCTLPSFSKNASRLLLPKRLLKQQVQNAAFRCQVPGIRCQLRRCQVLGPRFQGSGARLQASGARFHVSTCQVSGANDQVARDYVSNFRDQVPRQNVENFHIKNILHLNWNYKLILRLNGNYKLTDTFFTTLISSLACSRKTKEKHRYLQCPFRYFGRFYATSAEELICRLFINGCFCIFNNFKPT